MSERFDKRYEHQVRVLLEILPIVIESPKFALKGGTAINLFVRDLPRLSVDIDLTYLPIAPRDESIADINYALSQISGTIQDRFAGSIVRPSKPFDSGKEIKLFVEVERTTIKIEPNYILRGCVFPPSQRALSPKCANHFGLSIITNVVSLEDLYAGKICAALDRQHPRDLFDIYYLLENEGITEGICKAFLVYLMSHNRPMSELLDPNWKNLDSSYKSEFSGMSVSPLTMDQLYSAGKRLVKTLRETFTDVDRRFLVEFKRGNPDWISFFNPSVQHLPGILWKQKNLHKLSPAKRNQAISKLEKIIWQEGSVKPDGD